MTQDHTQLPDDHRHNDPSTPMSQTLTQGDHVDADVGNAGIPSEPALFSFSLKEES